MKEIDSISNIISKSVEFLAKIQNADGGIPYNSQGSPSGAWTTSGILWALGMANDGNVSNECYIKMLNYLYANQNTNGLMSYTKKNDMGCIDATAQFILGAILLERFLKSKGKKNVIKSIEALVDCVQELGWGTITNSNPCVFSTGIGLVALKEALNCQFIYETVDKDDINSLILSKINVIINMQNEDGGWGTNPEDKISKSASTAMAIIAIEKCFCDKIEKKTSILSKAISFLINSQNNDGDWNDVIERDAGFTVIRQSAPYCMSALALMKCKIIDDYYQRGLKKLLSLFQNGYVLYKESNVNTWSTRDGLVGICYIKNSILNDEQELIKLLEYNIEVNEKIRVLAECLENEKKRYEEDCKNIDEIVNSKFEQKLMQVKGRFSFLQISLSITIFAAFALLILIFKKFLGLSKDQIIAVLAILCAIWGTLTALIFQKGVE